MVLWSLTITWFLLGKGDGVNSLAIFICRATFFFRSHNHSQYHYSITTDHCSNHCSLYNISHGSRYNHVCSCIWMHNPKCNPSHNPTHSHNHIHNRVMVLVFVFFITVVRAIVIFIVISGCIIPNVI